MQINIDKTTETCTLLINPDTIIQMDSSVAHTELCHVAAVCYRELFTDDVIRTEGIRVELSQLATKHLNTQI